MTEPTGAVPPLALRVVHGGEPTTEELAAIVAVLSARVASAGDAGPQPLRRPLSPWVASGLVKGTRTRA